MPSIDKIEAITGVANTPHLQRRYHLRIEAGLPEAIADDILRDSASNIAPLLQILLRKMWDAARNDEAQDGEAPFTHGLYAPLRQSSLDALLDTQLEELRKQFPEAVESGLALDVLMGYTTARATADELPDEALQERYAHIPRILELKTALQRLFLLTNPVEQGRRAARLAHDALAPIIRKKYFDSDAPGQRARRIVETKEREIGFLASFSETDIATILAGEKGMQKIPDAVREQMKDDQERYEKQKQERFHLAFDTAHALVKNLKYPESLDKLWIASREGIYHDILREQALELPYFFLQTGQRDFFKESLEFVQKMGEAPDEKIPKLLEMASRKWQNKGKIEVQLRDWNPALFQKLEVRHFPEMCVIEEGPFQMGIEEAYPDEKPAHEVSVSSFLLAATPVSFWQYGLFCLSTSRDLPGDSGFGRGDKPVINVNWYEAVKYCNWLTERLSSAEGMKLEKVYTTEGDTVTADWSKNGFRLPTEAEWEYAAREGGRKVRFGNGKDVANPAEINFDASHPYNEKYNPDWYVTGKGRGSTTGVREFAPNALGLYDMSGNVLEWCWDWWSEEEQSSYQIREGVKDPVGPMDGSFRVVRGGSWSQYAYIYQSSYRYRILPIERNDGIGFRVARRL